MSYSLQPLFPPTQLQDTATLLFTAAAKTQIQALSVSNPTGSTYMAVLYWVPSGGTADATDQTPATTLLPGTSWLVSEFIGQVLGAGDALWGWADTPDVLNIFGSGLVTS